MREVVSTKNAPAAIGPYSQAIKANGFVFVSGQIPLDPNTMQIVGDDIQEQTRCVLQNLTAVLQAAGCTVQQVVKTTIFLKDMADFEQVNKIYGELFTREAPARATVQVAKLPKDVRVEIDAVAVVS